MCPPFRHRILVSSKGSTSAVTVTPAWQGRACRQCCRCRTHWMKVFGHDRGCDVATNGTWFSAPRLSGVRGVIRSTIEHGNATFSATQAASSASPAGHQDRPTDCGSTSCRSGGCCRNTRWSGRTSAGHTRAKPARKIAINTGWLYRPAISAAIDGIRRFSCRWDRCNTRFR